MGKRIILSVIILTVSTQITWASSFDVDLHGGYFATTSMSLWQLHQYKDTEMMRKSPLCWCPYKSYLIVFDHVRVEADHNQNWLVIDTDIASMVRADAQYNRAVAFKVKGTAKQKVKKIYRYCKSTTYVPHVKTARQVFETRTGDCAGIASAFYVLCKKNHIPVWYVIGWNRYGCHAWNRVKIGKRWYWIDCARGKFIKRKQFNGYRMMEMW